MEIKFSIVDEVKKEEETAIFKGLLEYNLARIEEKHSQDLGIYVKDENNTILAGLTGETSGNWLSIKYLWVSLELRGQKIGSQILKQAEQVARDRGCKYVFLDTFSFQAPEFYKKYGYQEVFALEEYPVTGKRYYFTKCLV